MTWPGDIAVEDTFNRADGAPAAGRPDLWATVGFTNGAADLNITGNKLTAAGENSVCTVVDETAPGFIWAFPDVSSGGPAIGWFWDPVANAGYFLSISGNTYTVYRRDGSGTSSVGSFTGSSLSPNQQVGIQVDPATHVHEVRVGNSIGVFPDDPDITFTDSGITHGVQFLQLPGVGWSADSYTLVASAPTSGVTIYVDPDHEDASDDRTRTEGSDADTPFLTVNAACRVARAGVDWHDTVLVRPSTEGNANPSNTVDPDLYPQLDHRWTDRAESAVGWTQGDNSGNEPIVVQGDVSDLEGADRFETWENVKAASLPRIHRAMWRGLTNWKFSRLRFGYEVSSDADREAGTGHDYSTLGSFERSTDITFEQCHATGGLGITAWWANEFNIDQCVIHSPLPPDGGNPGFHDGAGFRTERLPNDSEGGASVGRLTVTETEFSNVRGDDALTVGGVFLGDAQYDDFDWVVDLCLFHNVTEGDNPSFHTDGMQCLACPRATVTRTVFIGCSTAFIASDGRNGTVTFSRNLVIAAGSPFQLQGTDTLVMEHNTFFHTTALRDATLLFFTRSSLPEPTVWTFRNNIIGGIFMRDSSLAAYFGETSVFENNLVLTNAGGSTPFGDHLPGIPEFGHADRLDVVPDDVFSEPGMTGEPDLELARTWELANNPIVSPGIGQGAASSAGTDIFGRTYTGPPDVGCLQSDPSTLVAPIARPPYLVSSSPSAGSTGASRDTSLVHALYPKPGETLDTVTATLVDAAGLTIPAVLTVDDPDEDGYQAVTLDPKQALSPQVEGRLDYLVVYTWQITADDTEGSAMSTVTGTFRVIGRGTPAITAVSDAPLVGLRQARTAQLLNAGGTRADFEKPSPSAAFEQADASIR